MRKHTMLFAVLTLGVGLYAAPAVRAEGPCSDVDNDTICDEVDNCPFVNNLAQLESIVATAERRRDERPEATVDA